jgi:hypothetical protein
VASDVATNTIEDPRLVVILIDDALLPDEPWEITQTKKIGRRIVDELGPADLAAVVFSCDNRAPQDFTVDRAKLVAAIDRTHNCMSGAMAQLATGYSIATLTKAVQFLTEAAHERSAVMWVSRGPNVNLRMAPQRIATADVDTDGPVERPDEMLTRAASLARTASVARVPVYGISPEGLHVNMSRTAWQRPGITEPPRHEFLKTVSNNSGGRAILGTNAPADRVADVFRENSLHYVLGYRPTYPADGRFRRIRVEVGRRDARVEPSDRMFRTPAPVGEASRSEPETSAAMSGLVPLADERLRVALAPFADVAAGAPPTVAVVLGVEVPFVSGAGVEETVELETRVFDSEGRKEIQRHRQSLRVRPKANQEAGTYEVLSRLSLAPGRYNLRFASHSPTRAKSGSVHTDVVVPKFGAEPLSASGLVVAVTPGPVATPADAFVGLLPVTPTTRRTFTRSDHVQTFLRVYWRSGRATTPVELRSFLTTSANARVHEERTTLTPGADDGAPSASYSRDLSTLALTPGEYLYSVEMTQGRTTLRRDVRFHVR